MPLIICFERHSSCQPKKKPMCSNTYNTARTTSRIRTFVVENTRFEQERKKESRIKRIYLAKDTRAEHTTEPRCERLTDSNLLTVDIGHNVRHSSRNAIVRSLICVSCRRFACHQSCLTVTRAYVNYRCCKKKRKENRNLLFNTR